MLLSTPLPKAGPESMGPSQGLSDAATGAFLQRLLSLADVLLLSSSLSLAEFEADRRLSPGAALRQSLRLGEPPLLPTTVMATFCTVVVQETNMLLAVMVTPLYTASTIINDQLIGDTPCFMS